MLRMYYESRWLQTAWGSRPAWEETNLFSTPHFLIENTSLETAWSDLSSWGWADLHRGSLREEAEHGLRVYRHPGEEWWDKELGAGQICIPRAWGFAVLTVSKCIKIPEIMRIWVLKSVSTPPSFVAWVSYMNSLRLGYLTRQMRMTPTSPGCSEACMRWTWYQW